MAEHLAEDEAQGRGFDRGLLRRLFSLALPYKGYAGGALVVLFLESLAQLAGPLLTGAAIDLVFSPKPGPAEGGAAFVARFLDAARPRAARTRRPSTRSPASTSSRVLATFGFMFLMVEWTSRMGQGVMFDLRTRIFGHLQRADIAALRPDARRPAHDAPDDRRRRPERALHVGVRLAPRRPRRPRRHRGDPLRPRPDARDDHARRPDPDGPRDELVPEGGARHLPQGAREDRPRELLPPGAPLGDHRRPALPARGGVARAPSGRSTTTTASRTSSRSSTTRSSTPRSTSSRRSGWRRSSGGAAAR